MKYKRHLLGGLLILLIATTLLLFVTTRNSGFARFDVSGDTSGNAMHPGISTEQTSPVGVTSYEFSVFRSAEPVAATLEHTRISDRSPTLARHTVRGILVDRAGDPVVGAVVDLVVRRDLASDLSSTGHGGALLATSDSRGAFALRYNPSQLQFLHAELAELAITRSGHSPLTRLVSLGFEDLDLGRLELPERVASSGRIVEAGGAAVGGCEVAAWIRAELRSHLWPASLAHSLTEGVPGADTRTDAEGHFVLYGLEEGSLTFAIGPEDERYWANLGSLSGLQDPIVVPDLLLLEGRVLDSEGRPLPSAEVWPLQRTVVGWTRAGRPGTSDGQGAFQLPVRQGADAALGVRLAGFQPCIFELGGFAPGTLAKVRLDPGRRRSVQVVDATSGVPIEAAELRLLVERSILVDGVELPVALLGIDGLRPLVTARPDAGGRVVPLGVGRFDVFLDREGPWTFAASSVGFATCLVDEVPGDGATGEVRIELVRGDVVRGQVLNGLTGAPCVGVDVRVLRPSELAIPDAVSTSLTLSSRTDEEGRYRVVGVPPGALHLAAISPDFTPSVSDLIEFEGSGREETLDLRIFPDALIHGEIHSRDPALMPPYSVHVHSEVHVQSEEEEDLGSLLERSIQRTQARRSRLLTTDSTGRFTVRNLPAGPWRIEIRRTTQEWGARSGAIDSSLGMLMSAVDPLRDSSPPLAQQVLVAQAGKMHDMLFLIGRTAEESARLEGYVVGIAPNGQLSYFASYSSNAHGRATHEDRVTVDEQGAFDFGMVPPGVGNIYIYCRSEEALGIDHPLAIASVAVEAGKDQVVAIEIGGAALTWFDVRQAGTGIGIEDAVVQYFTLSEGLGFGGVVYKRDEPPRILPPGRYLAATSAPGWVLKYESFEIDPYQPSHVQSIELVRGVSQLTAFKSTEGEPLVGMKAWIREIDDLVIPLNLSPVLTMNDLGEAEMGLLPPGNYAILIFDSSGELAYEGVVDFTKPRSEVVLDTVASPR